MNQRERNIETASAQIHTHSLKKCEEEQWQGCGEESGRKQSPRKDPESGRGEGWNAGLEGRISDSDLCRAGRGLGRLWHMAPDLQKAHESMAIHLYK